MFVVRGTRPDALFAGVALSPYIVVNLNDYVWECVLRWHITSFVMHTTA